MLTGVGGGDVAAGGLALHGVDYVQSLIDCVSSGFRESLLWPARDLGASVPWLRDGTARLANFDCVVKLWCHAVS